MIKERLTLDLPDGQSMHFRLIPGEAQEVGVGEFMMGARSAGKHGSEQPIHGVRLTVPFYLGETQVTQAQYRAMAGVCLSELSAIVGNRGVDPSHFKGDQRPVERVSWDEIHVVCRWLSSSNLLPPGWKADLPTESQWEYACRAGTDTEYHSGDGEAALRVVGWFDGYKQRSTLDVRQKEPNDWGLYDMHGNLWEWCKDAFLWEAYCRSEAGALDPEVGDSTMRVLRGGAFFNSAADCRAACRMRTQPGNRTSGIGFRVGLFPGIQHSGAARER